MICVSFQVRQHSIALGGVLRGGRKRFAHSGMVTPIGREHDYMERPARVLSAIHFDVACPASAKPRVVSVVLRF
jgi:hypothetical protein